MATRRRANSKRGAPAEPERSTVNHVPSKLRDLRDVPEGSVSHPYVPRKARYPLLVASSMLLSYGLYTLTSPYTSGDLSTVSAHRDQSYEVAFFLFWRAIELSVGWYGKYDTVDQGSLTLLAHLPYLFFLTSFYKIRPTTAVTCMAIDLVAICTPFYFLRNPVASHKLHPPRGSVVNRSIVQDFQIQVLTSLFASGVYSIVVFGSFRTWVPEFFVTHFEGIKDISSLYNSQFVLLCAAFIPTGIAAKTFLFTPATAAKPDEYDDKIAAFDAETATFTETLEHNIYGHTKRVRVLMQRSLTLAAVVGLHTWLHTYLVVDGAEGFGAVGWSAIWSLAAIWTGLVFIWVGDVDI